MSGATSHHAGRTAEERVAARYVERGYELLHARWRGQSGEIDLILEQGRRIVFVEVKSGPSLAAAAERVSPRQSGRILRAAQEFLAGRPEGALTEARIDVALVDRVGRIEILPNALGG